jgi:hypothetical protein
VAGAGAAPGFSSAGGGGAAAAIGSPAAGELGSVAAVAVSELVAAVVDAVAVDGAAGLLAVVAPPPAPDRTQLAKAATSAALG